METKICVRCDKEKMVDEFHNCNKAKDGKQSSCKLCKKEYSKLTYKNPSYKGVKVITRELAEKRLANGLKLCSKCSMVKPVNGFGFSTKNKDNLERVCKECLAKYRLKNKARIAEYGEVYRKSHRKEAVIYGKAYRVTNKDKLLIKLNSPSSSSRYINLLPLCDGAKIDNNLINVKCKLCGKYHIPTLSDIKKRISSVTGKIGGENNFYCSDECKQSCPLFNFKLDSVDPRSKLFTPKSETEKARACQTDHLKQIQCDETEGQSYCEKCGDLIDVELHHTKTISSSGMAAVSSSGHILLCAGCHTELHKRCV